MQGTHIHTIEMLVTTWAMEEQFTGLIRIICRVTATLNFDLLPQ
jgi:hypothetical protein